MSPRVVTELHFRFVSSASRTTVYGVSRSISGQRAEQSDKFVHMYTLDTHA